MEPVFETSYDLDHHKAGERILRGEEDIGKNLQRLLDAHGINPFAIMTIVTGVGLGAHKDAFAYPINIDTIEGILRASSYVLSDRQTLSPERVLPALVRCDQSATPVLDEFWSLKALVYRAVVQHPLGLIADFLCRVRRTNVCRLKRAEG
jgi:hypothetical protein